MVTRYVNTVGQRHLSTMLTHGLNRRLLVARLPLEGHPIANTTVLIIVTLLGALALVGMVLGVRHTCRGDDRSLDGQGQLDEVAAKAQAAQIDSNIQAFRERGRRRDETARASETARLREQLTDRGDRPA